MRKLIVRVGDGDDYHPFSDLMEVANYLFLEGVVGPLERHCRFGLRDACDFQGNNYISCYYGPWPIPVRQAEDNQEISDAEIVFMNKHMAKISTKVQERLNGIAVEAAATEESRRRLKARAMVYQARLKEEAAAEIGLEDWRVLDMEFKMWATLRAQQWEKGTVIGACSPYPRED